VADDVGADLARMDSAGMQPTHIAECLQLLATEREANEQTVDRLQLVWTGPDVPGSVSRDSAVVGRMIEHTGSFRLRNAVGSGMIRFDLRSSPIICRPPVCRAIERMATS
jgi:hypothetical protein